MAKEFEHPLARRAKVWVARDRDGAEKKFLVVVTTLALDASHKNFNAKHLHRLEAAIVEFLAQAPEIAGYVIVNRLKDWDA